MRLRGQSTNLFSRKGKVTVRTSERSEGKQQLWEHLREDFQGTRDLPGWESWVYFAVSPPFVLLAFLFNIWKRGGWVRHRDLSPLASPFSFLSEMPFQFPCWSPAYLRVTESKSAMRPPVRSEIPLIAIWSRDPRSSSRSRAGALGKLSEVVKKHFKRSIPF